MDKAMTPVNVKRHIDTGAVTCLVCKSDNIEGGMVEINECSAYQRVRCLDCDASWDEGYKMDVVLNLEIPEDSMKEKETDDDLSKPLKAPNIAPYVPGERCSDSDE